jgi:PAP2 superfamily
MLSWSRTIDNRPKDSPMPKIAAALLLVLWAVPAGAQTSNNASSAPVQAVPAVSSGLAPSLPPDWRTASPPQAVDSGHTSFASLFRDLGSDFRQLPSRQSALVVGAAGVASFGVRGHDAELTRDANASESLDTMFEPGAAIGSGFAQYGAAFATWAIGRATHKPRVALLGADLIRAQIVSSALTQSVKFAIRRPRPDGGRYSFPSGHTAGTFATAAVLQRHYGWKVGAPAYGLAAYVAGSRLQENKHYMSDVIFGAAIGIVSGHAVTVGHGNGRFALAPLAAHGGGGIGLTLVGQQ